MKIIFEKKTIFLIIIAALILISVIVMLTYSEKIVKSTGIYVEHTQNILRKSNNVLIDVLNIETGTRGFIITGNEVFLEAFNKGTITINYNLNNLKELTKDNPLQQKRINCLIQAVGEKQAFSKKVIEVRKLQGLDAASVIIAAGNGKTIADKIRTIVADFNSVELNLLQQRKIANEKSILNSEILFLLLIIVIVFIFSLVIIFYKNLKTKEIFTEKLKKSNELFSNLFNHNPASISIIRLSDHIIVNVNDSFLKLYGFENKEEVIGKTDNELNVIIAPENSADIYQLMHNNSTIKDIESHIHAKNGEIKWTSASIIAMEINDEPCLLSVSLDITNRKKTEEQLITLNKELEAFTYSVSHDLRAPLRAINGYAKILQEDNAETLDSDGKSSLVAIMKNSKKMGELIDDLLAFSRLGRKVISTTEINMNGLVNTVREDVLLGITSQVEFSIAELYPAKGQQELIKQVWVNLLSNALKFSKHQAIINIKIGSEYKDNLVVYHVKDNGAGFDMNYYDKLFGVFQRLHSQEEFEGTGIGLAIVQKIVQRHNGKVWAESTLNEGTCFYFSLPTINS